MVSTRQMSIVSGCTTLNNDTSSHRTTSDTVSTKLKGHSNISIPGPSGSSSKDEGGPSHETTNSTHLGLFDMPPEIVEKIFSYLSFKNICHIRPVCRTFDRLCGQLLNSTFQRLQFQMLTRFQSIKSKMPRRESARRNHPLACESDIIETLHMRLTLLQMSFGKHIERKHCCFFPGEILDEVYRILHYIKVTPKLARPYKVTDELFDLSTMAMEYFKEKIEPELPEIAYFSSDFLDFTNTFHTKTSGSKYKPLDSSSPLRPQESKEDSSSFDNVDDLVEPLPQSNMVLRKGIRKIKQGMKRYNNQLSLLRQDLRSCKRKTAEQQKQIGEQQKLLAEQQKQTLEYATRLDENDKKNEETSRKFSTLLQELNKCKTELQYWRSKSPAMPPVCAGCGSAIAPLPHEDLQALVNQGVLPEGLGLHLVEPQQPDMEFVPIAGGSADADDDGAALHSDIGVADAATTFSDKACAAAATDVAAEPAAASPVGKGPAKRKAQDDARDTPIGYTTTTTPTTTTTDTAAKKSRRANKIRIKRVKAL